MTTGIARSRSALFMRSAVHVRAITRIISTLARPAVRRAESRPIAKPDLFRGYRAPTARSVPQRGFRWLIGSRASRPQRSRGAFRLARFGRLPFAFLDPLRERQ